MLITIVHVMAGSMLERPRWLVQVSTEPIKGVGVGNHKRSLDKKESGHMLAALSHSDANAQKMPGQAK